jgi:hypothetical protein
MLNREHAPKGNLAKFCNILHRAGVRSREVEEYKQRFAADAAFIKRSVAIEELFAIRGRVLSQVGNKR